MLSWIIAIQLVTTGMMTGLIWFVQIVHYPLLAHVGDVTLHGYHQRHMKQTTWLVMPLMLLEVASAIALPFVLMDTVLQAMAWVGLGLLLAIWLSTFAIQVPLHRRIELARTAASVDLLVQTNWLRTVAWSLRLLIVLFITMHLARHHALLT